MKAKRFNRHFISVTFTEEEVKLILLERAVAEYPEGWIHDATMHGLSGGGVVLEWQTVEKKKEG